MDSSAKLPCPWQGDQWAFCPEGWTELVLAQGKALWLDCHSLDGIFGVTFCIDFSPLSFTSLGILNIWCILNVPASPAGRWHCHMVSSSLWEPQGVFFWDALDCSYCQVPALGSVPGWSCPTGLRQSCSSASPFCGAILRPLLFPKSSLRHSGLSLMPIHSPTAASGSVLGEFRVKMLQGWWVLLCRISTIIRCARSLSV